MSRTLFENSKAALAFAGITIVGTAIMIGPSESGGVLDRTADSYVEEREAFVEEVQTFAEEQSVPDEVFDPDSGWGGTGGEVFGEFELDDVSSGVSQPSSVTGGPAQPAQPLRPATAARQAPRVQQAPPPVMPDRQGIVVPRPDESQDSNRPRGVPVITNRQMTIEPQ